MKWMIRTGSTPAERARLRVVYALAEQQGHDEKALHHKKI